MLSLLVFYRLQLTLYSPPVVAEHAAKWYANSHSDRVTYIINYLVLCYNHLLLIYHS